MQLIDIKGRTQPDPFIFQDGDKFFIYATGEKGVYLYFANDLFGPWHYYGKVYYLRGHDDFWAPSVIKLDGVYYMYCSCNFYDRADETGHRQTMCVATADSPFGPFKNATPILPPFSIDSHIVKNDDGLFLFYSRNNLSNERIGTEIVVDRMLTPYKPAGNPKTVVKATLDEDIYMFNRYGDGRNWHTIEGGFYFREGNWHYLMYSGNCYQKETYYVGFASAYSEQNDLTKIDFKKYPDDSTYSPVLCKDEFEEGTGHNSVIKYKGEYYCIYHGRQYGQAEKKKEMRTARICRLEVKDGVIKAIK